MTFLDLRQKEVINCRDCRRLGCVADIEIDPCSGNVCALIVPAPGRFFSCFGRPARYLIHFCDVKGIGPDIILVDVCLEEAVMEDELKGG